MDIRRGGAARVLKPERLEELTTELGVPGAAVGVLAGDEVTVHTVGVTKLGPDGAPVTADTLFLIGSITKVWTATLIMRLVEEGRLDLDEPVNSYLNPPLRLADAPVAGVITARHLLTHTGGFLGDDEDLPDRGDDAVERTVAGYADLPQLHRPGSLFSYSNSGYTVLGRLVECLTGQTWDDAVHDRLIEPLGLSRTTTRPERALVQRVAVGHERLAGDRHLTPVPVWLSGPGSGPCGGTLATTAGELLAFARMHLRDGLAAGGTRVLGADTARAMREPQVPMVDPTFGDAWGLGWAIPRVAAPTVVGHSGNTNGQESQLLLVPEHDLAMCVLTNGDVASRIRQVLCDELLAGYVGVTVAPDPTPAAAPTALDPAPFLGTFARPDFRFTITADAAGLHAACRTAGNLARRMPDFTSPLTHSAGRTFLLAVPGFETRPRAVTFVREGGGDGPATHLAFSGRVLPRVPPDRRD